MMTSSVHSALACCAKIRQDCAQVAADRAARQTEFGERLKTQVAAALLTNLHRPKRITQRLYACQCHHMLHFSPQHRHSIKGRDLYSDCRVIENTVFPRLHYCNFTGFANHCWLVSVNLSVWINSPLLNATKPNKRTKTEQRKIVCTIFRLFIDC